jgi:multisubunit Na+/H+ antiporter MnhE subunit
MRIYKAIKFFLFYLVKLSQANIFIAYDILTPKVHSDPGFIWIPIRVKTNLGFLMFSNLVSMTPGTLSIDFSEKRQALLVHYMYNNEGILKQIENIQDKIIDLTE